MTSLGGESPHAQCVMAECDRTVEPGRSFYCTLHAVSFGRQAAEPCPVTGQPCPSCDHECLSCGAAVPEGGSACPTCLPMMAKRLRCAEPPLLHNDGPRALPSAKAD